MGFLLAPGSGPQNSAETTGDMTKGQRCLRLWCSKAFLWVQFICVFSTDIVQQGQETIKAAPFISPLVPTWLPIK